MPKARPAPQQDGYRADQLSESTKHLERALSTVPWLAQPGKHFKRVSIGGSTTKTLTHGLGYEPEGYLVTRITGGDVSLYEDSRDSKTITIGNAGAAGGKFDIFVY